MDYIIGEVKRGRIAYSIDAKFPSMNKAQDFVIYPHEYNDEWIAIQSDKRFAIIYPDGKAVLSASHASYANFMKLQLDIAQGKEKRFTLEETDLKKLQPFMKVRNEVMNNGVMQVQY